MQLHPELRSLHTNGALTESEWENTHFSSDAIGLLLSNPNDYIDSLGPEWDADLDTLPFNALAHLARYLPQLQEPKAPLREALRSTLEKHADEKVELIIEAGCSVGADLHTLSQKARRVIGFDAYITPLRYALKHITGQSFSIPQRNEGRGFSFAENELSPQRLSNVSLICADALDPPFLPECADIVVAMNLLDNVPCLAMYLSKHQSNLYGEYVQ